MRGLITFVATIVAVLVIGASSAWAGGVNFVNTANTDLKFFTQGVMRGGGATEWKLWHLHAHHHTRLKCDGCTHFNFEIRTDGRHPVKYTLDLDKTYKLRYNNERRKWDLFQ